MAFPTIPTTAGNRILFTLTTTGSATRTFPNLGSLTKSAGDLLIAVCVLYQGNSTNAEFSSWGASFTERGDSSSTTTMAIGIASKWSDGTETGTFTVTTANTTSTHHSVQILMSIAGAHASTVPALGAISHGTSTAADPGVVGPPSWGTEDTLWIAVCGLGETSTSGTFTTITAAPTNWSGLAVSSVTADAVGGVYAAVAFRQLAASTEDMGPFTMDLSSTRNSNQLILVRPAAPPAITQAAYRWYEEGTESGAVPYVAQDTAVVGNISNGDATGTLRVRLQATTAVAVPATDDWQLQYEKNTSGTWINVSAVTTNVSTYDSPNLTNAAATTNRLTGGTGSFVAGKVSEDSLMDDLGWAGNNYTELVYALKVKAADVVNGDTLRFRILRNGATTAMTYSVTPTINIVQFFNYNETNLPLALATGTFIEVDRANRKEPNLSVAVVATITSTDTYTPAPPPLIQEGFRWRNDDGSEVAATWKAAQDANTSLEVGQAARLRVLLDTTADHTAAPTLYYKKSTDSTFVPVPVGSGGGAPVYVATSSNITASGEAATAQLAAPAGKTASNFFPGRMWDDENGTDSLAIVGGFMPTNLSGLYGWWDADDASTFSYSSSTVVSEWRNKQGVALRKFINWSTPNANRNVTQNGRSAISFSSTIDGLLYGNGWTSPYDNVTVFGVARTRSTSTRMCYFSHSNCILMSHSLPTNNTYGVWHYSASKIDVGPELLNQWSVQTYTHDTTTATVRRDGGLITTSTAAVTPSNGENWVGGAYYTAGWHIDCDVAELIVYDRVLTAAEITQVESYLQTKWGTPWSPAYLTSLAAWYDATDDGVFTYGTGTQVSEWKDKSPNLYHTTVTAHPNRRREPTAINGRPAVVQDHASGIARLSRANVNVNTLVSPSGTDCMLFVVMQYSNTTPALIFGVNGSTYRCAFDTRAGTSFLDVANYTTGRLSGDLAQVAGVPYLMTLYRNGANMQVRINGQTKLATTTASGTAGSELGTFNLISDSANAGRYGEFIHFARYDATDLATVETYLSNKWGIPLAWDPSDIPGLGMWYDPSDTASIAENTGVGTGASRMEDKSGFNRWIEAGGATKPLTGTRTIGGRNVLYFDPAGDAIGSNGTLSTPAPTTMFIVAQADTTTGNLAAFGQYNISPRIGIASGVWTIKANNTVSSTTAVDTNPHVLSAVFQNSATSQLWLDGTLIASGNTGTSAWNLWWVFGSDNGGNYWNGTIGEAIVYHRELTTAERLQVERYLQEKWKWASVPAQVDGLAAWYDAADTTTFTYTTGSQMSEWRDKSPNAFHLTTDNHANLTRTGNIHGLTCVLSDHGGVEMIGRRTSFDILNMLDPVNKTDCMNFFVVKLNALSGMGVSMRNASQRVSNDFYQFGGGFWDCVDVTGGRLNHGYTFSLNTPYLLAGYRNGTNMAVYLNGVQIASKSDAGTTAAVSEVGTLKFPAGTNNGNVGEGIHVARYDATDFALIQDYLMKKWILTIRDPADITGLQAWYDASDAASFTYSSSTIVSQWNDKSGNGRNGVQATVGNQPNRNASQNGKAGVTFDGTNDFLLTPSFTLTQPFTVCATLNWQAFVNLGMLSGSGFSVGVGGGGSGATMSAPTAAPVFTAYVGAHSWSFSFNGASSVAYKDGVASATVNPGTGGSTNGLNLGYNNFWGSMFEVVIYDSILSTGDRQAVENYLKAKWGTP